MSTTATDAALPSGTQSPGHGPGELARRVVGSGIDDTSMRRFLFGLPGVDEVGADARAAKLATRSIKTTSKQWALDAVISMIDLTTLEGSDTPGKIKGLAAKALQPDIADPGCPPVAALCVYGDLVPHAVEALRAAGGRAAGRYVKVAAVATAFPSGRASRRIRLADTAEAVAAGADEIDMVIDRGAFLSGRYGEVFDDILAVASTCVRPDGSSATLKVILETGELGGYDAVRRASWLAMLAGADTIKTSTGKIAPAATMPVMLVMLEAVRDFESLTGRAVGVKPAGGIRASKDAIRHLVLVQETTGPAWLTPDRYRFGASSLLTDVLLQRRKLRTGAYSSTRYFSVE